MSSTYLMYLRKSRQDDPNETVEEVLAKHETMLQEYAEKELGGRISENNIYREVVSGESIEDRVEIKRILARIEYPDVEGVIVIEPQRLSRGDLEDCGKLINDFRFTHTKVCTPVMTYDLENKMERKFFQDELLRGRDYLEYTKEILFRGRIAAVKRGCYISPKAPFGYNRVKIGRDWTLEPNDDADAVRLAFDLYVNEGLSLGGVARRLNELGYRGTTGVLWQRETISILLGNIHYAGKVHYNEKKQTWTVENGERKLRILKQPESEVIIAEGKHDAIVDMATFEAAKNRLKNNPRFGDENNLKNVLAGVLRCAKCGKVMTRVPPDAKKGPRYTCKTLPRCYKSAKAEDVLNALIIALEQSELPNLRAKQQNREVDTTELQKRRIEKLTKQLEEYRQQEDTQYELLETKKYTQEVFDRRNAALRAKMDECEKEIRQARQALPKKVDYDERIASLEKAIEALKAGELPIKNTNKLLRAIIDRVEYSAVDRGVKKTDITLEVFLRL